MSQRAQYAFDLTGQPMAEFADTTLALPCQKDENRTSKK